MARIFPLRDLPSNDYRFKDAYGDVTQHRVNNPDDWGDDYIFTDPRFNLLWGTDQNFLKFLEMTVHPVAISNEEAASLVETYNQILSPDGYEFRQDGSVSGHPLYKVGPIGTPPWETPVKKVEPIDEWETPVKKVEPIDPWAATRKKVAPADPPPWETPLERSIRAAREPMDSVADLLPSIGGSQESISPAVSIPGGLPVTSGIKTSPDEWTFALFACPGQPHPNLFQQLMGDSPPDVPAMDVLHESMETCKYRTCMFTKGAPP